MRWLARLCAGLAFLVCGYLLAAVLGAVVPGRTADLPAGADVEIVLIAGPIHYDILMPLDAQTRAAFGFVADAGVPLALADWLVVGWGSHAFYTATGDYTDLDARLIWTAATGDASVMRFDAAAGDWTAQGIPISLSNEQFSRLRGEVLQGLARDTAGFPQVVPGAALTGRDVFYEAKHPFSILQTCNVWIGDVLRDIGVPMGFWTPTPFAVTLSHWWFSSAGYPR